MAPHGLMTLEDAAPKQGDTCWKQKLKSRICRMSGFSRDGQFSIRGPDNKTSTVSRKSVQALM